MFVGTTEQPVRWQPLGAANRLWGLQSSPCVGSLWVLQTVAGTSVNLPSSCFSLQGCGGLAPSTFYHTGYTGTLLCCDPTRNVTTVLLTNRVWPARGSVPEIQAARQAFNDAVLEVLAAGLV